MVRALSLIALLGLLAPLVGVAPAASAQQVDPAAEEAFFTGVALLEAGDAAGAVAKFDQALRIDASLRRVHYYRAKAWVRLGDIGEATTDAEAYAGFPLSEAELGQLEELRAEIAERAEQIGAAVPREPRRPERPPPDVEDTGPDGLSLLRDAEAALARGDCEAAVDGAQAALQADNTLTRAFLVKGLALECQGEAERALTVIEMYDELRAGMPEDPVSAAAKERLTAGAAPPPAAPTGPGWSVLGSDPGIQGILGQQWGMPMSRALEVRTRRAWVPGAGSVEIGKPRMSVGGSTTWVERAWGDRDGALTWSRMRVFERGGIETTGWYVRVFSELYREVEASAGEPESTRGLVGSPEDPEGAHGALKGTRRIEARWTDADGDVVVLRMGRCTVTGAVSRVHPDNAACVELLGWSGSWEPPTKDGDPALRAHQRIEAPGRLQVDVSGGFGFGFGPQLWIIDRLSTSPDAGIGGELGLDTQVRVAFGPLVVGASYALSLTGYTALSQSLGPFADHRFMAYVGVRDRPRQRQFVDFSIGAGLVPESGGVAPAVSLRIQPTTRTAPIGRFFASFEPYLIVGTDVTFVPIRFTFGGLFGTKQRPVRER